MNLYKIMSGLMLLAGISTIIFGNDLTYMDVSNYQSWLAGMMFLVWSDVVWIKGELEK